MIASAKVAPKPTITAVMCRNGRRRSCNRDAAGVIRRRRTISTAQSPPRPGARSSPSPAAANQAPTESRLGRAAGRSRSAVAGARSPRPAISATTAKQRRGQVGDHGRRQRGRGCSRRLTRAARARPRCARRSLPPPRSPPARGRTPSTGLQPSFAAAIASTPEPVPRSRERRPRRACSRLSSSSSSRHSRVVAWAPVPKARPGSIDDVDRTSHRARSQEGRSQIRPPTSSGLWKSLPAVGPVVGDLRRLDLDQPARRPPPRASRGRAARPRRRRSRTRRSPSPGSSSTPFGRQHASSASTSSAARRRQRTASRITGAAISRRRGGRARRSPRPARSRGSRCSSVSSRRAAISRCSSLRLVGTTTLKRRR